MKLSTAILFLHTLLLTLSCTKPDRSDYAKRFDYALGLKNLKEMPEQVSLALLTIPIDYQQTIPFQIYRDISYLKLLTNPDCIIGEITKITFHGDRIYILDRYGTKNLYAFDLRGKFIAKIKAFGEGPLEIGNPQDFDFTPGGDELVVYEGMRNKLVYYDRQLKPQREVRLGLMLWNFATLTDSLTLIDVNFMENYQSPEIENYNLLMLGPRFDPVLRGGEFAPIRRENSFTAINTLFKLNTNRVMWAPKFQNAVYAIDSTGRVTKEIALDLGDKEMPKEFYEQEYPKFRKYSREHNKSSFSGDFVENTETQYIDVQMPLIKDKIYIFVDKGSQRYIQGKLDPDVDRKGVAHPLMASPVGYAGNRFVTFLEANTLARAQDIKKYYPDVSPELVQVIRVTKKTDNPIILLYSVKF